jgi:hypothetical protein
LKRFRQGRSFIDLTLHAGLQTLCNRGRAEAGEVRSARSIAALILFHTINPDERKGGGSAYIDLSLNGVAGICTRA